MTTIVENTQYQLELIVKIAETQLQSNLPTEEERNKIRIRIAVAKHKIKELERKSNLEKTGERKTAIIPPIKAAFKWTMKHIETIIISLIIIYVAYLFGWNK